ncbi:hypothetical protein DM01DRAFT_1229880 [Hesseltinella vesiculosa]|uniref:Protein kinase domain-containing protein n=1 Tax=Hesseltinella vesiculosa TaxID=101127 RepID=A0A1X2GN70_9FUNG|nr:hypothetical protein DM01DRAFT_1229880 [Hesseltinella vesiculosa]
MTQDINSTRQVRFSSDQPTVFTYGYTSDHDEAAADECDQPDELDPCSQLPGSPLPSVLDKILGGDELPATTTSSCQHKRPLHDDSTSQPEAGDTESPPPQDSHKRLHLDVRPLPIPASSPSSSVHSPSSQNDNLHSNNSTPSPNTFTAPLPTHQPASWSDRLASKRLSPDSPFFDGPTALPLLKSVDTQDDSQNDTQDTCDPPFFSNRPLQRSLLPEFLQHLQDHTNDTDPEDDDNDALSDLAELSESFRKSKQRIVDSLFADEEDYNDADFASASTRYTSLLDDADHSDDDEEGIYSSSAFSSLAAPRSGPANSSLNDEIDQFFFTPTTYDCSSSNFDYHTPKLSIDEQQQRFLHYGKSLYLTVWPHFLNMDYFDQHDAKDRSQIDPEDDDVSHTTFAYFDTKFTVIEKLGSGEYADVWKVKPRDSEQVYAVKKLKTSFQSFTDR